MAEATQTIPRLLKQIQAIVGIDHAIDEPIKCDLATSDVFERSEHMPAVMVVKAPVNERNIGRCPSSL
jgi:hypothetical protein